MAQLSYKPTGPVVPPTGPLDCKIAFVGARPGKDEAYSSRIPFSGPSGRLLWHLFGSRHDTYVTNVRQDLGVTYSNGAPIHPTPTRSEIDDALPCLRDELSKCGANILVALGGEALYSLTGKHSIENWRGSIIESNLLPGRKVLSTWHPAACLYQYNLRYVLDLDLRRAKRQSEFPDIRRPVRTFDINPSFESAISGLRNLGPRVAVDIETFDNVPNCVGIADSSSHAILIPFIGSRYSLHELAQIWRELDVVFRTRDTMGQNFQFDVTRLERLRFKFERITHDTMLSHHLLWTELGSQFRRKAGDTGVDSLTGRHSLAFISSIYTEEPYYKHESELAWGLPGLELGDRFYRYWGYCCKDACVTYEASEALERELTRYGQKAFYEEQIITLIRPLIRLQARGLRTDLEALARLKRRMELETNYLQLLLDREIGFDVNVFSAPDLRELISRLGLRKFKETKSGAISADKDTLLYYAEHSEYSSLFHGILEIRKRRTLTSNFLNIPLESGRYCANYLLHGTDTGRLSSRANGKGPQLQNIPPAARRVFVPEEGHTFIEGDYKRAEAMYVAYDSECEFLIRLFEDEARDLYLEVAAESLEKPAKDVTAYERHAFKQVVLGNNYGLGPDKLVATLRVRGVDIMEIDIPGRSPRARAQYLQAIYFKKCPEIKEWQKRIQLQVQKSRVLVNALGRRKVFLDRLDPDSKALRSALAYPAQSTIGVLTNRAVRILDQLNQPIVGQLHDAILGEPRLEDEFIFANELERAMLYTINMHNRNMTIPVELKKGSNWGEMKPYENLHSRTLH